MIVLSHSAAGTWCGASHGGHVFDASGVQSSSARAALLTTSRGGASPAPPAPPAPPAGARATARGSGTGTSCSERIRGQRATVGGIELEGVGDEVVRGFAALAAARERRPHR